MEGHLQAVDAVVKGFVLAAALACMVHVIAGSHVGPEHLQIRLQC
jgi:hypothetical protein